MVDLPSLAWPVANLAEALEVLARRSGFAIHDAAELATGPGSGQITAATVDTWLSAAAHQLGLETEAVTSTYADIRQLIRQCGPALLNIGTPEDPQFLVVLKAGPWNAKIITPDLSNVAVPIDRICEHLTRDIEHTLEPQITELLDTAQIDPRRYEHAKRTLLNEQLSGTQIERCWLLRLSPSSRFWSQLKHHRIPLKMLLLIGAHALQQGLQVLGWWLIAHGALSGRFDRSWLYAWGLVLLTSIPFELLVIWCQSLLTVGLGGLFKKRLLFGTLQLHPEEIRHQGIGQFLGRVLESESLENMMLGGGFAALIAFVELAGAAVILSFGAGQGWHSVALIIWCLVTFALSWRYYKRSGEWRAGHRGLITALIERMVGHRTRLAQQPPGDWHQDEDQALTSYLQLSRSMDASSVQISGIINRGWLLIGLGGIAYPLIHSSPDATQLAISLGGIMLAAKGFNTLIAGLESVVGVLNAWKQIGPLFHAATRNVADKSSYPLLSERSGGHNPDQTLLVASDLVYRYRDYGQPILQGCDLRIHTGDRLLLEGPSGGGKSTLASLFTGLRHPTSGLLLLHGLDRQTLGSQAWRQRIVAAPQFHENHVLAETFAFNLLMGRRWPPVKDDIIEALTLCDELGLGDLLQRMPAGLQQMIGESGWQLSHGERSRLFIARALLQKADMIVLDESFAALDPENLRLALQCVLKRAPTLFVIAHP